MNGSLGRQRLHEVTEVTTNAIRPLRATATARIWIFYQRRPAARPVAGFDVGIGIADEPGARELDVVAARRLQHKERLRLAATAAILGAVVAIEEFGDWRAAEQLQETLVRGAERFDGGLPFCRVRLVRDHEDQPPVLARQPKRIDDTGEQRHLIGSEWRAPFAVLVTDQRVEDAVAIEKESLVHKRGRCHCGDAEASMVTPSGGAMNNSARGARARITLMASGERFTAVTTSCSPSFSAVPGAGMPFTKNSGTADRSSSRTAVDARSRHHGRSRSSGLTNHGCRARRGDA